MAGFLTGALLVRLAWTRVVMTYVIAESHRLSMPPSLLRFAGSSLRVSYCLGSIARWQAWSAVASDRVLADLIARATGVGWVLLVIWTALRCFNAIVAWYVRQAATASTGQRDIASQASFMRKTVSLLVAAIGLLYVLRAAGVDIAPLLASGAIGGFAVALALQDTLSNVFAGYALAIDRPVRVGDFVKLESGEEGFVEEIGWRNTRIRMWSNNVVVVPNAKLSQSIITNYYLPRQDTTVYVHCGVSYDSDLEQVEQIVLDVARQVQHAVEGADPNWEPAVRWKEFADSAVTFVAAIRAKDFGQQYLLQSEFVQGVTQAVRP